MSDSGGGIRVWSAEGVTAECPRCGERVDLSDPDHECDGEELAFDGVCPMCGVAYESYMSHLKECDGGA